MPRRRPHLRAFARILAGTLAVAFGIGLGSGPAAARVVATGKPDNPGTTKVVFTVDRGCGAGGQGTTALKVRLPDGTTEVVPQSPPGWTARTSGDQLVWTGGPAPGPVAFETTLRIPGMVGDVVYLPAVQVCGATEEAWSEQGPDPDAARAAPRVALEVTYLPRRPTATAPGTSSAPPATSAGPPATAPVPPAPSEEGAGPSPLAVVGLVAVLAAVVIGGMMAARRLAGGG